MTVTKHSDEAWAAFIAAESFLAGHKYDEAAIRKAVTALGLSSGERFYDRCARIVAAFYTGELDERLACK